MKPGQPYNPANPDDETHADQSRPKKRLQRSALLRRLQTLIGNAQNAYTNDRSACRASGVLDPLTEAFDIVVSLRARYKP